MRAVGNRESAVPCSELKYEIPVNRAGKGGLNA